MKRIYKSILFMTLLISMALSAGGCSSAKASDEGQYIIDAKALNDYIGK